ALEGKVNFILVADGVRNQTGDTRRLAYLPRILKETATLEDYGIKLQVLDQQQQLSVESQAGFISDALAKTVDTAAGGADEYLSYLVNSIRREDGRAIPYSIVTGVNGERLVGMEHHAGRHYPGCDVFPNLNGGPNVELNPIILNEWAGSDLQVKVGDRVTLE